MGKVWVTIFQVSPIRWVWLSFPMLWEIDEKTNAFPIWWSVPQDGNLMEKITHTMRKVWVTIFQVLPHTMGLTVFSHVMGNWWENTCISHVTRYTMEWESNWKKAPILWEMYEYQFPRFSPYNGFCCIFLYYGKLMVKPMHFPHDDVFHRMGTLWGKITHTMGKVWVPISQVLLIRWVS